MKIEYTNISFEDYTKLSDEERKAKPFYVIKQPISLWYNNQKNFLTISSYILNKKYHREDGPARIYSNGNKFWYLNNVEYSFEEFLEKTPISYEEKIFLRLKYS